jgi:hypothetical protein
VDQIGYLQGMHSKVSHFPTRTVSSDHCWQPRLPAMPPITPPHFPSTVSV